MYKRCEDCAGWAFCDRAYPAGYDVSVVCKRYREREDYIELPLKIGQEVWFLKRESGGERKIVYTEVRRYVVKVGGLHLKLSCGMSNEFPISYIGKYIFASRAEAEAALEARRKK